MKRIVIVVKAVVAIAIILFVTACFAVFIIDFPFYGERHPEKKYPMLSMFGDLPPLNEYLQATAIDIDASYITFVDRNGKHPRTYELWRIQREIGDNAWTSEVWDWWVFTRNPAKPKFVKATRQVPE